MGQNHFWFRPRIHLIGALWKIIKPPLDQKIADIGVGSGDWIITLHQRGYSIIGIDYDRLGLNEILKQKKDILLIQADAKNIPLADQCLAALSLLDVLEHLEDDRGVLKELHRILQPNGHLLISVPAFQWLWSHRDIQAGHYRRYHRKNFEQLLQECGFHILNYQYYLCWLFPILLLSRFWSRLGSDNVLKTENHPPAWVNQLFYYFTLFEVKMSTFIRWPFGCSLFIIAQKK